jgi:formylglycine-generating enzyme required for sulfatase activity
MEDDFGKTRPNIRMPDDEPEDYGMTMPNIKMPRDEPEDFGATRTNLQMPQEEADFGTTAKRIPRQEPSVYQSGHETPRPQSAAVQQPQKKGGIPIWVWALGGFGAFLFVLIIIVILAIIFWPKPGFTLVIQGAPPNSRVFVDNKERGTTTNKGELKVKDLRAGETRSIRVTCEGYADFNGTVIGKNGEEKIYPVDLKKIGGEPPPVTGKLPKEIDHNGPMVLVDAGDFIMGSNNFNPDEKPEHTVNLPAFYIDKYEVTNAQYKKFCDETNRTPPTDHFRIPGYFLDRPNDPVVGVSWEDAQAYATWAKKRLPTEQEWEKAASWDDTNKKKRKFAWGDEEKRGNANIGDINGNTLFSNPGKFPNDVSAYGVFDMTGNVAEWVDSFYKAYPGNNDSNPDFGETYKVVRGGTYKAKFADARTTRRFRHTASYTEEEKQKSSWLIGFRCVVSANDPEIQTKIRVE